MAFVNSFQNFYYNGKYLKYTELCTPLPFSGDKIHIKDVKIVRLTFCYKYKQLRKKINSFTVFKPHFLPKLR